MEKRTKQILGIVSRALCIIGMIFLIIFASIILAKHSRVANLQTSIESAWNTESGTSYTIGELMNMASEQTSLKADIQSLSRAFEISAIVTGSAVILLLLTDYILLRKKDRDFK